MAYGLGWKHGLKFYSFLLNVEVYFFQPFLYIKAGTAFPDPGEVSVPDDVGIGIVRAEALQEFYYAALLGFGSGVGGITVGVQAALITDSD